MLVLTGQQIINNALTALGINEQGGTPNTSDSTDSLNELNDMWDAWSVDEGLIYQYIVERFPLVANISSYTIGQAQGTGPAGQFNAPAPARVYRARVSTATGGAISTSTLGFGGTGYVVNDTGVVLGGNGSLATYTVNTVGAGGNVLTYTISGAGSGYAPAYGVATQTGGAQPGAGVGFFLNITVVTAGGETRTELEVVSGDRYYRHRDLQASALTPDELYPDYNPDANGLERLFLFPVPTVASPMMLELEIGVNFTLWSLTASYPLPQGAADAIKYALAFRLIPRFGALVSPQKAEFVTAMAEKSEARFRDAVAHNRQIPAPAVAPSADQAQPAGGA